MLTKPFQIETRQVLCSPFNYYGPGNMDYMVILGRYIGINGSTGTNGRTKHTHWPEHWEKLNRGLKRWSRAGWQILDNSLTILTTSSTSHIFTDQGNLPPPVYICTTWMLLRFLDSLENCPKNHQNNLTLICNASQTLLLGFSGIRRRI